MLFCFVAFNHYILRTYTLSDWSNFIETRSLFGNLEDGDIFREAPYMENII